MIRKQMRYQMCYHIRNVYVKSTEAGGGRRSLKMSNSGNVGMGLIMDYAERMVKEVKERKTMLWY